MKNDWYQLTIHYINKWRQEKPLWLIWGGISLALIFYYLIVILNLNSFLINTQNSIATGKTTIEWMAKASQEIIRLRQVVPHEKIKTKLTAFALVNQAINDQGWNNFVNEVHQIDENRVQVNFKTISFNELIDWLRNFYDKSGVYVLEATIEKVQPGIVSASLVLQKDNI